MAFSRDSKTLATGGDYDGSIKLWDIASGKELNTLSGPTDMVTSIAFAPDGSMLAAGSKDGTVRLWKLGSTLPPRAFNGNTGGIAGEVTSVTFSPDGKTLASGSRDGSIKLWKVSNGRLIYSLVKSVDWAIVYSVAFSSDGSILAAALSPLPDGGTIRLWDVATGSEICTLSKHTSSVYSLAFSQNGMLLASGSADGTIRLWGIHP